MSEKKIWRSVQICDNEFLLKENEFGEFDYPVIVKIINVVDKLIIMFFTFEYSLRETNQRIYFACLFVSNIYSLLAYLYPIYTLLVCLYPINVTTVEPIRPKFCLGLHLSPGKVYRWSKFQNFASNKNRLSIKA